MAFAKGLGTRLIFVLRQAFLLFRAGNSVRLFPGYSGGRRHFRLFDHHVFYRLNTRPFLSGSAVRRSFEQYGRAVPARCGRSAVIGAGIRFRLGIGGGPGPVRLRGLDARSGLLFRRSRPAGFVPVRVSPFSDRTREPSPDQNGRRGQESENAQQRPERGE